MIKCVQVKIDIFLVEISFRSVMDDVTFIIIMMFRASNSLGKIRPLFGVSCLHAAPIVLLLTSRV